MPSASFLRFCCVSIAAATQLLPAQNTAFIQSSAGGLMTVAPGSLATLYRVLLPVDAVQGQPGADGQLPTGLGGYTLEVDGTPAQLSFVGPTQVNFVVPPGTRAGKAQVELKLSGQVVVETSAAAEPVAPAIFTQIQNSREMGALLNAVTFQAGPFNPETAGSTGCDTRTRLAIFATGMAFATSQVRMRDIQAEAQDSNGNRLPLEVEAAQPSAFIGLDQVNIAIPYAMGPGTYLLRIVANGVSSNSVQFDLRARDAAATAAAANKGACLGRVSIKRVSGQSPEQFAGTVSLAYPAQAGGAVVNLQGGDASVTVPASVSIAEGQTSADFQVALASPRPSRTMAVIASLNSVTRTGTFDEGAPCVNAVWLAANGVVGGQALSGTVAITDPASDAGTMVTLMSSNPAVEVSPTVMIPAGRMSAGFSVSTAQSFVPESGTITAVGACGGSMVALNVVVFPCISAVTMSASSVAGGGKLTGTVNLNAPAMAGGLTVNLKSSDPSVQIPAQILVSEGQTSVDFPVTTTAALSKTMASVTAYMNCGSASALLAVNPGQ